MFLKLDWGIIWPIVNIVVFYLLLRKFLFGPVSEVMEQRKKMISSDLDDAAQTKAEAEEIKRYEESEKTEFTNPLVNLFDKLTALKQWKLSAEHAEINAERILTLSGHVTLQALEPTSKLQRIETDHLSVNLTTKDVFTDSEVKSQGLGFTTSGIGLKGNLKLQVATLLKDVKSYIEPTVIKAANEQEKDKQ